ncbi:hypothetical protein [Ferruginibacter sp.]|uniref:ISAzo13-like element transposase-related protein n=1 Tax=Ferruginibacter sp. TaxID=1940288 RepID=UPI0019B1CBED|nr:hypothetical protein [Ferruginibacter sp.]
MKLSVCCLAKFYPNRNPTPLINILVFVDLIGTSPTKIRLKVNPKIDSVKYKTKINRAEVELQNMRISKSIFYGYWNYIFKPNIEGRICRKIFR